MADQEFRQVFTADASAVGSEMAKVIDEALGNLSRLAGSRSFGSTAEFESAAQQEILAPLFQQQGTPFRKALQTSTQQLGVAPGRIQEEMLNGVKAFIAANRAAITAGEQNKAAVTESTREMQGLSAATRGQANALREQEAVTRKKTAEIAAIQVPKAVAPANAALDFHRANIQRYIPETSGTVIPADQAAKALSSALEGLDGTLLRSAQHTLQYVNSLRASSEASVEARLSALGLYRASGDQVVKQLPQKVLEAGGVPRRVLTGSDAVAEAAKLGVTIIVPPGEKEGVGRYAPFLRNPNLPVLGAPPAPVPVERFTQLAPTSTYLDAKGNVKEGNANRAIEHETLAQLRPIALAIAATDASFTGMLGAEMDLLTGVKKLSDKALQQAKIKFRLLAGLDSESDISLIAAVQNAIRGRQPKDDQFLREAPVERTTPQASPLGVTGAPALRGLIPTLISDIENPVLEAVKKGLKPAGYQHYTGQIASPRETFELETDRRGRLPGGEDNPDFNEPIYRLRSGKKYGTDTAEEERPERVYQRVLPEFVAALDGATKYLSFFTAEGNQVNEEDVVRGRLTTFIESRINEKTGEVTKYTKPDPRIASAFVNPQGELEDVVLREDANRELQNQMQRDIRAQIAGVRAAIGPAGPGVQRGGVYGPPLPGGTDPAAGVPIAEFYSLMAISARRSAKAFDAEANLHEEAVALLESIVDKLRVASRTGLSGLDLLTPVQRAAIGVPPQVTGIKYTDAKKIDYEEIHEPLTPTQEGRGSAQALVAEARRILAGPDAANQRIQYTLGNAFTGRAVPSAIPEGNQIALKLFQIFDEGVSGAATAIIEKYGQAREDYFNKRNRLVTTTFPAEEDRTFLQGPGKRLEDGTYGPPAPFYGTISRPESTFYTGARLPSQGAAPENQVIRAALKELGLGEFGKAGQTTNALIKLPPQEYIDRALNQALHGAITSVLIGPELSNLAAAHGVPSELVGGIQRDPDKAREAYGVLQDARPGVDVILEKERGALEEAHTELLGMEYDFADWFSRVRRLVQVADQVNPATGARTPQFRVTSGIDKQDFFRRVTDPTNYFSSSDEKGRGGASDGLRAGTGREAAIAYDRAAQEFGVQLRTSGLVLIADLVEKLAIPKPRTALPSGADPGEDTPRFSRLYSPDWEGRNQEDRFGSYSEVERNAELDAERDALHGYDVRRGRADQVAGQFGSYDSQQARAGSGLYTPAYLLQQRVDELGLRPKGFEPSTQKGSALTDRLFRLAGHSDEQSDEELTATVKEYVKEIRKDIRSAEKARAAAEELAAAAAELAAAQRAELLARPQITGVNDIRGGFGVTTSIPVFSPGIVRSYGEARPPLPIETPGVVEARNVSAGTYVSPEGGQPFQRGAGLEITKAPEELAGLLGNVYRTLDDIKAAVNAALAQLVPETQQTGAEVGTALVLGMKRGLRIASPSGAITDDINPEVMAAARQLIPQMETLGAELGAALTKSFREALAGSQALIGTGLYGFQAAGLNYQATKREGEGGGRSGYALTGPGVDDELGARRFDSPSKARDALGRSLGAQVAAEVEAQAALGAGAPRGVDADQTARLTRGPLNRIVRDEENSPAAIAAAKEATAAAELTAAADQKEAAASDTATAAEKDLAAVIRRKITALEAQIVATEAATEAEATLAGAAGAAAGAKGAGAKAAKAAESPGPGLSEEEKQRARDQGARRQERTAESRAGARDSDAFDVGEEEKYRTSQEQERARNRARVSDYQTQSEAYEKYRSSGYQYQGPGVDTESAQFAKDRGGPQSVNYTEAEGAYIEDIRNKAAAFGQHVNEEALQSAHYAAILEAQGAEKLQEYAQEKELLIRLSAEQEQYEKQALAADQRYVIAKGEGNAIQARINALITQSEHAARLSPEGQETSRLNAGNEATGAQLAAQEARALQVVDPETGKSAIDAIAKANAEEAAVTTELAAKKKQELAASEEYLTNKTAEIAAERELTEALKYRSAAERAGVRIDPNLTGSERLAATATLDAQNRAADSVALRASTEELAAANLETALTQQQQKAANAAALAASEEYLQAESGAAVATKELQEAVKYRTLAMRAGVDVDPALAGAARTEAIARLSATEALEQQAATLRAQLGGDQAAIVLQAETNLLKEEYNRELAVQMATLRKDPNFQKQIPNLTSASQGGTFFQRLQATTKGKPGTPAIAEDQPTFGQFVGQKAATTFGFLLTGSLLYGGLTAIRSMVEESTKLETTLTQVKAEFNSLGEGGQFDEFREDILSISKETGVAASEVAQVALQFKGAFGSTTEAAKNTREAIELSVVAGLDLKEITDQLTAAAITYDTSVGDIGDKALALQENTGVLAKETISAISQIAEVGKSAGLTFNQLGAIIAVAQQTSGRGGAAIAESFGRVIPAIQKNAGDVLRLYESSPQLKAKIPEIAGDLSSGNTGQVLIALSRDWDSLTKSQQNFAAETLGGRREAQQILGVLSNYPKLLSAINAEQGASGKTAEYFSKVQDSVSVSMKRLQQTFRQIGEELLRGGLSDAIQIVIAGLRELVTVGAAVIHPFAQLNEATGGWAIKLGVAAVAFHELVRVTKTIQAAGLFQGAEEGVAATSFGSRLRTRGANFINPPAFGRKAGQDTETAVAGKEFQTSVVSAGEQLKIDFIEIGQQMKLDLGLAGSEVAGGGGLAAAETAGSSAALAAQGRAAIRTANTEAEKTVVPPVSPAPGGALASFGIPLLIIGLGVGLNQYMQERDKQQKSIDDYKAKLSEKDNKDLEALRKRLKSTGRLKETVGDEGFWQRAVHGLNPFHDFDPFPDSDSFKGPTREKLLNDQEFRNTLNTRYLPVGNTISQRLTKQGVSEQRKAVGQKFNELNIQRGKALVEAFAQAAKDDGSLTDRGGTNIGPVHFSGFGPDDKVDLGGSHSDALDRKGIIKLVEDAKKDQNGDAAKLLKKYIDAIYKRNPALAKELKRAAGTDSKTLKAELATTKSLPLLEEVQTDYETGAGSISDYLKVATENIHNLGLVINGKGSKNIDPKLLATYKQQFTQIQQGVATALKDQRDIGVSLNTFTSGREDPGGTLALDTSQINSKAFRALAPKDKIAQYQQFLSDEQAQLAYLATRASSAKELNDLLTNGAQDQTTKDVLAKLTALNLKKYNEGFGDFKADNKEQIRRVVEGLGLDGDFADNIVKYAQDNNTTLRDAARKLIEADIARLKELQAKYAARGTDRGDALAAATGLSISDDQSLLGNLGGVPNTKVPTQERANFDTLYSALQDNAGASRAVAEAGAGKNGVRLAQAAQTEAAANLQAAKDTQQSTNEIKRRQAALDQSNAAVIDAISQAALSRFDLAKAQHLAAGDKVAAALDDLDKANEELNNVIATGGDEDAARANQVSAQAAADETRAARTRDLGNAIDQFHAAQSGNPREVAENAKRAAQRAVDYANATHDDVAAWQAMAELTDANRAAFDAQSQILDAQSAFQQAVANYSGDAVKAAQIALAEATRHQIETRQNRPNDKGANANAATATVNAQRAYYDSILSTNEDDIQFGLDMETLSTSAAIKQYEALLTGKNSQQLTKDQRRDIQRRIKGLKDELGKDATFDVPDNVTLPTLYEARRLRAAGTFANYDVTAEGGRGGQPGDFSGDTTAGSAVSTYNDNRQQTIQLVIAKEVDADAVLDKVTDAINAPPRLGTVSKVY